jgi:hypothetical protein
MSSARRLVAKRQRLAPRITKCVTTEKTEYAYHMSASAAVANLGKKYLGLIAVSASYHTPNPACNPYIKFTVMVKGKSVGSFKDGWGDSCWRANKGWTPVVGQSKYGYAYCETANTPSGVCPMDWVFPIFPYDSVVDASLWGLDSAGTYGNTSRGHNVSVKLVKLGNNLNTGP